MEGILNAVYKVVWSPALVILLVGAGLYFSIRTRFVQVRRIGFMTELLFSRKKSPGIKSFSPFQAFCVSLSGRVGTGNIVGVATAIALGGPGAVFWMWTIAFLGASTAFTEATLAQKYRFNHDGGWRGGPSCYIEKGLHLPWAGVLFAVLTILGYGILPVIVQSNGVSTAFENSFSIKPLWSGLFLAALLGAVIIGGVRRIAHVATAVTPFMSIVYIIMALVIVAVNIESVPRVFGMIFSNAFGINPIVGGMLGSTIAMGVKRGLFSNEAGQGAGAIVAAGSDTKQPAHQGLVQAFSVYVDTLLVCTATALMILTTGCFNILDSSTGEILYSQAPQLGANYVGYTQAAVDTVFSGFGGMFVSVALLFFVFTTIMAYYFYAESSIMYIFSKSVHPHLSESVVLRIYRALMLVLVFIGAFTSSDTAWTLGDIGIGITTWINVIALLLLFPQALAELRKTEMSRDEERRRLREE